MKATELLHGRMSKDLNEQSRDSAVDLFPVVYAELRRIAKSKLANEKPGQTLQATALLHEAYLRLVDSEGVQGWNSSAHFCAAAAEAMRRILIEKARHKMTKKRGGDFERIDLREAEYLAMTCDDLLGLDDALIQLEAHDARKAQLVKLRFFVGLTVAEAAEALAQDGPRAVAGHLAPEALGVGHDGVGPEACEVRGDRLVNFRL